MKQAISFITVGVSDLAGMVRFYREVFEWVPLKEQEDMVLFQLNGFVLALYPAEKLAADIGVDMAGKVGGRLAAMAINLLSKEEVDAAFSRFRQKGVTIITPPEPVVWGGYRGYIADIEGNYWEIVWNPRWKELPL